MTTSHLNTCSPKFPVPCFPTARPTFPPYIIPPSTPTSSSPSICQMSPKSDSSQQRASSSKSSSSSPYPAAPARRSSAQPKSSRQQFSACGACRMRRQVASSPRTRTAKFPVLILLFLLFTSSFLQSPMRSQGPPGRQPPRRSCCLLQLPGARPQMRVRIRPVPLPPLRVSPQKGRAIIPIFVTTTTPDEFIISTRNHSLCLSMSPLIFLSCFA